jgi:F-type H+/Na+-transporting ATPase subunit alpha
VPLERMTEAEQAVREAATEAPGELLERLAGTEALGDADREAVTDTARHALALFLPTPEPAEPEPA